MSLRAVLAVFDHSESQLATRLVALALADHAHDDGSNAYPSVDTIARKARVNERTVRRGLRWLERQLEIMATGRTKNGTTVYHFTIVEPLALPTGLAAGTVAGADNLTPKVVTSLEVQGSGGNQPSKADDVDARPRRTSTTDEGDPGLPIAVQRWIGANAHKVAPASAREILEANFDISGVQLELAVAYHTQRRHQT